MGTGAAPGVDAGLLPSRSGQPHVVPVIRVPNLEAATVPVLAHGGTVVVEPFTLGC
ncbi:VOC family protein [Dactylosporangium sp. CS-047395]|uniref:VOC family protein n=1 Tax=Dactylosporangium sp. CS-047395 TaxID=3239936 RepID=UPI003D914753